ncbi:MAG: methylamine methyltransferase corrinoid protein reductive activase [Thermoplasmatales archaeon]|nr:methylamine methyltransferase corrinoid protein reductive activase [Thermoplasmatales archaeon]
MEYGIALDLGTSGFRTHLVDLKKGAKILDTAITVRHPIPGANIMDHLHFWMNSGPELGHAIIMKTVRDLISFFGRERLERVSTVAICGNPIQLSMFENIEVRDLAFAGKSRLKTLGIIPPERKAHVTTVGDIGDMGLDPEARVIVPPAIRHEIGADALAMIIKSRMLEKDETCLVTDYGTNAEMGLYYEGELYSGSAAAGPAMEGQSIAHGMLAAPHAISDLDEAGDGMWDNIILDEEMIPKAMSRVNPVTGAEVKIVDYPAHGITGTGVVSAMALGLRTGLITRPGINTADGKLRLADGVLFTEADVGEAGKAMGAIRAGHRTLMETVGITEKDVNTMYMAGASGTYVDPVKAQDCGMIPRVIKEVYQLGNTSLMMAHDLLKGPETLDMMQSVADSISANHVMFAGSKTFEDMYVLEIAYWDEGMPLEMYNDMLEASGIPRLPDLVRPEVVKRLVKSDIPEKGEGLHTLQDVGGIMSASFEGCTLCGKCQRGCPERALTLDKAKRTINVRSDLCLGTACKACELNCPEKVYVFTDLALV